MPNDEPRDQYGITPSERARLNEISARIADHLERVEWQPIDGLRIQPDPDMPPGIAEIGGADSHWIVIPHPSLTEEQRAEIQRRLNPTGHADLTDLNLTHEGRRHITVTRRWTAP